MKIFSVIILLLFTSVWAQDTLTVSGMLQTQEGQCPMDWVPLFGKAGQALTVQLTSDDFDSYLYLSRSNSTSGAYLISEDDDSGGGLEAEIRYTLDRDGFVYVGVSSIGCSTGSYTLESRFSNDDPDEDSLVGVLNEDSEQMPDGRYINWHRVYLTRGVVTVRQNSDALDAYIFLARDTGNPMPTGRDILERSDECASETLNACVTITVEQSGYYLVGASSYEAEETGFYRIEISTSLPPVPTPPIQRFGTFTRDDERFYYDHTPIDWHTFTVPAGGARVVIDLTSDDVDPYLMLARCHIRDAEDDDTCFIDANDDSNGLDAQLDVMLTSGTYYVGANMSNVAFGSYALYIQFMPDDFVSGQVISSVD
jgi:hypothetical protein